MSTIASGPSGTNEHNDWDRIERYFGSAAFQQLSAKRVAVVGLGSGGGFAALSLAMCGVGHFTLIDPDDVSPANVVRHVADRRDIDRPKVQAVADLIRFRNPAANLTILTGTLEEHLEALAGVDVVLAGVDDERPKYTLNDACRSHNLPAIYAGVYERGEGGDVALIYPDHGPCYACWASHLRDRITEPGESAELDYGQARPDGTFAAEPGLWLHVVRIASVQAEIALNILLQGTPVHRDLPGNTVIMANVAMEIMPGLVLPPYGAQWLDIARDPHCLVCGQPTQAKTAPLSFDALVGDMGAASE